MRSYSTSKSLFFAPQVMPYESTPYMSRLGSPAQRYKQLIPSRELGRGGSNPNTGRGGLQAETHVREPHGVCPAALHTVTPHLPCLKASPQMTNIPTQKAVKNRRHKMSLQLRFTTYPWGTKKAQACASQSRSPRVTHVKGVFHPFILPI